MNWSIELSLVLFWEEALGTLVRDVLFVCFFFYFWLVKMSVLHCPWSPSCPLHAELRSDLANAGTLVKGVVLKFCIGKMITKSIVTHNTSIKKERKAKKNHDALIIVMIFKKHHPYVHKWGYRYLRYLSVSSHKIWQQWNKIMPIRRINNSRK